MIRALIIDDEKNGRNTLKALLSKHCPEIEIIGEGFNIESGIDKIESLKPDIVFLDIEMPDGTGFDLLSKLDSVEFEVIFVTAKDKYVLRAFQFSAIDYLLKPVNPELLISSVQRFKKTTDIKYLKSKIDTLLDNKHKLEKIILHTTEGVHIVKVENIIRCSADDYYTIFHINNGKKITVSKTLKEYTEVFEGLNFFRTHQSHLINLDYIDKFVNTEGGYIVMQNGDVVEVSRRRKKLLLDTLQN